MVYVLLAEGFEEVEAITTVDILRRAGINTKTISIDNSFQILGGQGVKIVADHIWSEADFLQADMIVLPGGAKGVNVLMESREVEKVILDFMEQEKWIAAICAAPVILAEMGLLENIRAVCYPAHKNGMKGAITGDKDVEVCKNIITSKAAGTSHYFAHKIVEVLVSKEAADQVIEKMYYEMER